MFYPAVVILQFWALIEVLRSPVSTWQAAVQNQGSRHPKLCLNGLVGGSDKIPV
jgi:hypothetical protein